MKKILSKIALLSTVIFTVSCENTEIPTPEPPVSSVTLFLNGNKVPLSETFEIYRGEGISFSYEYSGVSKIVPEFPDGWDCVVSRASGTITITAPEYSYTSAQEDAVIHLNIYDGSGSEPSDIGINVRAVEKDMDFTMDKVEEELIFSIGSQYSFTYSKSSSVRELAFSLPKGWKVVDNGNGTFTVTAPDFSEDENDFSGNIVVTPISWSGKEGLSLAVNIPVQMIYKSTFQFEDNEVNFHYGETKTLNVIAKGIKSMEKPALPDGWSGDFSNILEGTITITAPEKPSVAIGRDSLKIIGTTFSDESITSSAVNIRLYGVNDKAELLAFREIYGATANEPAITGIDKYLINGEISLNSDIELFDDDMASVKAYFIKYLVLPFNGNGHKLTIHFSSEFGVGGIFQYVKSVSVHDLVLDGSFINNTSVNDGKFAALACFALDGSSFENITSTVNLSYMAKDASGYRTNVAGLAAELNGACTFKNCKVGGKITVNAPVLSFSGIVAKTDASKPGKLATLTDCEFFGEIEYSQTANNNMNTRSGGLVGDAARQIALERCKFSGKILLNLNNHVFLPNNGRGVGGVVARITAPANGYTMSAQLTDCEASGTIIVNNMIASDMKPFIQLMIGCQPGNSSTILTETGSVITGSVIFN